MMIESWNDNVSYNQYYAQCAPKHCSYFITSRNNALYVFTTMIGLFGGLSVALKILVPLIVGWIRNKMRVRTETINVTNSFTCYERVHALWRWIKKKIFELNLFESDASWDDHHRRQYEIISTRIYLLLLTFAIGIIIVYTIAIDQTQTIIVKNPSQRRFEKLVSNPGNLPTLDCPCQNIHIPYESFMSISPHYHQLCSSDFVVENCSWINFVHYRSSPVNYSHEDYRLFVLPHFRLLCHLCALANDALVEALRIFHSNKLITKRAQSRQVVEAQVESVINQFRLSTPQTFIRMLDFIRQMAQGNGLVSSISSNWFVLPTYITTTVIAMRSRSYGVNNCSCGTNSMCVSSATIDTWRVPGFLVGCSPLESLLQSTLECLYDVSCINRLKMPNQYSNITIRPLKYTLSSPNVTVQSLVNLLMVDRWEQRSITYEQYYASCAPSICYYVPTERANPIYLITTIIGVYGGLTVALQIIVPVVVKTGQYLAMCRRQRIEPMAAAITDQ
ncbi:hypothetical protein I4U23_016319 [Adineta vaga]|nr:hypothetical protein I4U23_016319 [Adineta vaga]